MSLAGRMARRGRHSRWRSRECQRRRLTTWAHRPRSFHATADGDVPKVGQEHTMPLSTAPRKRVIREAGFYAAAAIARSVFARMVSNDLAVQAKG
jgi:hypothetical protein